MFSPGDEGRHQSPTADAQWVERFALLGAGPSGCIWAELTLIPADGRAEFRAAVLAPDQKPLVLVADELEMPSHGLEFRGSGIWVELVCESSLVHWSYGLEAFALELDSPTELTHTGMGHRRPLGWELEFESSDAASGAGGLDAWGGGYSQRGQLHGVLLTEDGESDWTGAAVRGHSWGVVPAPALQLPGTPDGTIGWVAVPGLQQVTVGEDAGGVSVI